MSLDGYLARLGLDRRLEPTAETLTDLHRRHLVAVPYDNLDIMLGRPESIARDECLDRLAHGGRGGYCFQQNAAFGCALEALGYDVWWGRGHVWTLPERRAVVQLNHLLLTVSGLPSGTNPGGTWWPDVGLGDGFLDPLPLVTGAHLQSGFRYGLTVTSPTEWTFDHDPQGSFIGIDATDGLEVADLTASHHRLSTEADGAFTRILAVLRRDHDGYDIVRGCVHTRVTRSGRTDTDLPSYDEWRAALEQLGLSLEGTTDVELRALHARMWAGHQGWVAAGRP